MNKVCGGKEPRGSPPLKGVRFRLFLIYCSGQKSSEFSTFIHTHTHTQTNPSAETHGLLPLKESHSEHSLPYCLPSVPPASVALTRGRAMPQAVTPLCTKARSTGLFPTQGTHDSAPPGFSSHACPGSKVTSPTLHPPLPRCTFTPAPFPPPTHSSRIRNQASDGAEGRRAFPPPPRAQPAEG